MSAKDRHAPGRGFRGRYSSASEVVPAGLRLPEEREASLAALRYALTDGEDSGASDRSAAEIQAAVRARDLRLAGEVSRSRPGRVATW